MQLPSFNKKSKHPKHPTEIFTMPRNRIKQERFDNRFIIQKPPRYDALQDPHTSYYFSNKSVKQHLKILKKAIKEQRNKSERSRLKKLIAFRINKSYDEFVCQKTSINQKTLMSSQMMGLRKISVYSSNSNRIKSKSAVVNIKIRKKTIQSKEQIPSSHSNQKEAAKLNIIISHDNKKEHQEQQKSAHSKTETLNGFKTICKISKQARLANKLAQSLHQMKHKKWVSFLKQKTQKAAANLEVSSKLSKSNNFETAIE